MKIREMVNSCKEFSSSLFDTILMIMHAIFRISFSHEKKERKKKGKMGKE